MPKNKSKTNDTNKHNVYLVTLLLIIVTVTFKFYDTALNRHSDGYVLSKNDDNDDNDSSERDENDDNDDNDSSERDEDDDNDDNDSSKHDESGDDDENEVSKSQNKKSAKKTSETVRNTDGTVTVSIKETEGNKIKIKSKTYSATGKVISEKEVETESKVSDSDGFRKSSEKTETEVGKLKIEQKLELSGSAPKTKIEIENEDTNHKLKFKGIEATTNFPIKVDPDTGKILVETQTKTIELKSTPDIIALKAAANKTSIDHIEVETEGDNIKYKVTGKRQEKILGVFGIDVPTTLTYNADSGELERTEVSGIMRFFGFLTF